jgi:nucleotide-binding universal stress UspA family protein
MPGPILFCYDGSEGSRSALAAAAEVLAKPANGFVLTVWQPAYVRLALAGAFAPAALSEESQLDMEEETYAHQAAEEGAARARDHGYDLEPLVERGEDSIAHCILKVADERDARLIVCGQRGRGPLKTTLLGSVSHALSSHTRRPILIAPEHHRS